MKDYSSVAGQLGQLTDAIIIMYIALFITFHSHHHHQLSSSSSTLIIIINYHYHHHQVSSSSSTITIIHHHQLSIHYRRHTHPRYLPDGDQHYIEDSTDT